MQAAKLDLDTGRRAYERVRLGIPARLTTLDGSYSVRLDNLSPTGAHISRPREDVIARGILEWFEFEAYGEIVWQRLSYCGMQFEKRLDDSWVEHTRRHASELIATSRSAGRLAARDWAAGQLHLGSER